LTVAPFTVCPGPVLRWLLPALITVGFDQTDRDVFQLSITEEQFQIAKVRAVAGGDH